MRWSRKQDGQEAGKLLLVDLLSVCEKLARKIKMILELYSLKDHLTSQF